MGQEFMHYMCVTEDLNDLRAVVKTILNFRVS
jgi:hypothetical protein